MESSDVMNAPGTLVAELTHRCPLACPYCSNPLTLVRPEDELDLAIWSRVFAEAFALGIGSVRLSGGEPGRRRDLVEIAASAREAGLRTNLITSGVGISTRTMRDLWEAGLHAVHVSFQDCDAVLGDRLAGHKGTFHRKYALATEASRLGLDLTINFVLHRSNVGRVENMVELALALRATRVELVPMRLTGWAVRNAHALAPDRDTAGRTAELLSALADRYRGRIEVVSSCKDRASQAREHPVESRWLVVGPSGAVQPGHRAGECSTTGLWNVRTHALSDIMKSSAALMASACETAEHDGCEGPLRAVDGPAKAAAGPDVRFDDIPLVYRR